MDIPGDLEKILSDGSISKEEKFREFFRRNENSEIVSWIVSGLKGKNSEWDFNYLLDYLIETSESGNSHRINFYPSPSGYGSIILDCKDGMEHLRLNIEYESGWITDMTDISPKKGSRR
jgi:hypothetical protein